MRTRSRALALCLTPVILLLAYVGVYNHYHHNSLGSLELREDDELIATSNSWTERQKCRLFGFCGSGSWDHAHSLSHSRPTELKKAQESMSIEDVEERPEIHPFWLSGNEDPTGWSEHERILRHIPQYVLDYAPLVYLFSGEEYWPSDIAEHLEHTKPYLNYTPIRDGLDRETVEHLAHLNKHGNKSVFLQSDDDVETKPKWLLSRYNKPVKPKDKEASFGIESTGNEYLSDMRLPWHFNLEDDAEAAKEPWATAGVDMPFEDVFEKHEPVDEELAQSFREAKIQAYDDLMKATDDDEDADPRKPPVPISPSRPKKGGRSPAPVTLIVADKGNGVVDAFWFFFYSYNLGNKVFNVRFGNHVGDWEHTCIRFYNGTPKAVFVSEHDFGDAYLYEAMEKIGKRPVVYVGTGTHAMYVTPGLHPYVLPWGLLHDETDRGPLWDPNLNFMGYTLDYRMHFRSSTLNPLAPTSWLMFNGRWGDKAYPLSDHRQYRFAGQAHYVSGPTGPRFKNLGRKMVCQGWRVCRLKRIRSNPVMRPWTGGGPGQELSAEVIREMFDRNKEDGGDI